MIGVQVRCPVNALAHSRISREASRRDRIDARRIRGVYTGRLGACPDPRRRRSVTGSICHLIFKILALRWVNEYGEWSSEARPEAKE
jgi:hypothetical protein